MTVEVSFSLSVYIIHTQCPDLEGGGPACTPYYQYIAFLKCYYKMSSKLGYVTIVFEKGGNMNIIAMYYASVFTSQSIFSIMCYKT